MIQSPTFSVRVTATAADAIRLSVRGELDIASSPDLVAAIARGSAAGRRMLVDLSGVEFMDSTGIAAMFEAVNDAELAGRRLEFCGPFAPPVQRILELTGVLPMLPLVDD